MGTPAPDTGRLPRVLGPWMATALLIGTVIGSGVFKKPHAVARNLNEFGLIMLAWVLVGVLSFVGSLILAEVAIIHPRAGGNYVFLREGYGRWAGFLWGWVEFWIIRAGSIAALASIFTEALHDILRFVVAGQRESIDRIARATNGFSEMAAVFITPVEAKEDVLSFWTVQLITVTVIAVLAFVNMRGTILGAGLQVVVTSVKVLSLLTIAVIPFILVAFALTVDVDNYLLLPTWPTEWGSVDWTKFGAAMVGILWSYHGWMNLAPVAEEVKDPNRNLPFAFLMGSVAVIVIYLSVNVAYHLVVARPEMVVDGRRSAVATIFAARLFGPVGLVLASLALMTSVFGSLNGNLLVGPRLLYAMGQDGLAPQALSQLHSRWGTPALAGIVLTAWSILLVLGMAVLVYFDKLGKSIFDGLTDYAMFGAVAFETMAVASIFVCRRQYPVDKVALPYRCWGYPVLPIFYVAVMAAVLVNMFVTDLVQSLSALGLVVVGGLVYVAVFANRPAPPLAPPPDAIRAGEPPPPDISKK